MESMDKIITEFNKIKNENEMLKNSFLEFDLYKKSMTVCQQESEELISRYRNHKAHAMKELSRLESQLGSNRKVIEELRNKVTILRIENTNLKEELGRQTKNDTTTSEEQKTLTFSEPTCFIDKELEVNPNDPSYTCDICKKVFASRTSVSRHIVRTHTEKKICKYCPFQTKYSHSYARHLDRRHIKRTIVHESISQSVGENNLNCPSNRDQFSSYTCNSCDKVLKSKTALKYHMYAVHPKNTFKCTICLKEIKTRYNYRIHLDRVHKQHKVSSN